MAVSKTQLKVLECMAKGWRLHYVAGCRADPSAFVAGNNTDEWQRVKVNTLFALKDAGLVVMCSDPAWAWRGSQYALTDAAKKILEG